MNGNHRLRLFALREGKELQKRLEVPLPTGSRMTLQPERQEKLIRHNSIIVCDS